MKIPKSLFVIAICLFFVGQAYATATFDASADVTIGFSQIWNNFSNNTLDLSSVITGFGSASGTATANENQTDISIEAFTSVSGSAGDAIGSVSGTVQSIATKEVIANFIFSETTTVPFTITILDHNVSAAANVTLPEESASAVASFDILLDSTDITTQLLNSQSESMQFDLSGVHSVILTAHTEGFANSPAQVPEPTTMLLLGSGLLGLWGARRKLKK